MRIAAYPLRHSICIVFLHCRMLFDIDVNGSPVSDLVYLVFCSFSLCHQHCSSSTSRLPLLLHPALFVPCIGWSVREAYQSYQARTSDRSSAVSTPPQSRWAGIGEAAVEAVVLLICVRGLPACLYVCLHSCLTN